jgi:cytoskeletal protein RodZ
MSNLNNRDAYSRETQREVYRDANGNTHVRDTERTPVTNGQTVHRPTAYRDGYMQGRVSEQRLQEENLRVRDNDNAARGLMIGIVLTSLAGLIIGLLFFLTQRNETPVPTSSPVAPSAAPANPQQNRESRTTIIERNNTTREVVPVPQEPVVVPDVNVNVPDTSQQQPVQTTPNQQTAPTQPGVSGNTNNGAVNSNTAPVAPQTQVAPQDGGTTNAPD